MCKSCRAGGCPSSSQPANEPTAAVHMPATTVNENPDKKARPRSAGHRVMRRPAIPVVSMQDERGRSTTHERAPRNVQCHGSRGTSSTNPDLGPFAPDPVLHALVEVQVDHEPHPCWLEPGLAASPPSE